MGGSGKQFRGWAEVGGLGSSPVRGVALDILGDSAGTFQLLFLLRTRLIDSSQCNFPNTSKSIVRRL